MGCLHDDVRKMSAEKCLKYGGEGLFEYLLVCFCVLSTYGREFY